KLAEQRARRMNAELERRVAERTGELERSNEELRQFAYVASHDLQEPMRMVASYTELLSRRYRGRLDDTADEYIDQAVAGAKRMHELLNDLLAYARVGIAGPAQETVSCEDLLDSVRVDLGIAILESGAVITHDPLPEVPGNASQLRQLFQNLIGN